MRFSYAARALLSGAAVYVVAVDGENYPAFQAGVELRDGAAAVDCAPGDTVTFVLPR